MVHELEPGFSETHAFRVADEFHSVRLPLSPHNRFIEDVANLSAAKSLFKFNSFISKYLQRSSHRIRPSTKFLYQLLLYVIGVSRAHVVFSCQRQRFILHSPHLALSRICVNVYRK